MADAAIGDVLVCISSIRRIEYDTIKIFYTVLKIRHVSQCNYVSHISTSYVYVYTLVELEKQR